MANGEQLSILKKGVEVWNKWLKENPDAEIDLSRAELAGASFAGAIFENANLTTADLRYADLGHTFLKRANLSGSWLMAANLIGADLRESNLSEANLTEVILTGADLTEADLYQANLSKAKFWIANLTKANLLQANLQSADLREADLTGAILLWTDLTACVIGDTRLGDNDLSNSIGLETIRHASPSIIGTHTIRKSEGKIPVAFLRGCGLSDLDIEYAQLANPDLSEKEITSITHRIREQRAADVSIRYNSAFISYSTKDQDFANRLYDDLQNSGVRCWFAPHDIKGGNKIHEQISEAIQMHDRLLLVLSENSMNSEWVNTEIANARQKEIKENRQVLFPISIVDFRKIREWKSFDADTGKDSAREIREYFIPDFSNWQDPIAYQHSFGKLLQDLKA